MTSPRTDKTYAVGDVPWLYPHRDTPPRGVKLNILQQGGVAIHDQWREGYIAWQYLFRRDKEAEEEAKFFLMEEVMDSPIRRFRVPKTLPPIVCSWRRLLNARWHDDADNEVAAIFKVIDHDGFVTPITYQYDRRQQPQLKTGYGIVNTGLVFSYWSDLVEYWPKYLAQLESEESESVTQKEMENGQPDHS